MKQKAHISRERNLCQKKDLPLPYLELICFVLFYLSVVNEHKCNYYTEKFSKGISTKKPEIKMEEVMLSNAKFHYNNGFLKLETQDVRQQYILHCIKFFYVIIV